VVYSRLLHIVRKVAIARFVLENTTATDAAGSITADTDKKLLAQLHDVTKDITDDLQNFRYHLASEKLYHYVWHELADKVLEESKPILAGSDLAAASSRRATLYTLLTTSLKLLHPFMPFVTEVIWQQLPAKDTNLLMIAPWPTL
jgi:valyl-tRNA synthetase